MNNSPLTHFLSQKKILSLRENILPLTENILPLTENILPFLSQRILAGIILHSRKKQRGFEEFNIISLEPRVLFA